VTAIVAGLSLALLTWMCVRTPVAVGDAGEYLLTVEALANHGTPDVRAADAASLGAMAARWPLEGGFAPLWEETRISRQGQAYTRHFWAYSLAVLPAKTVLRLVGGNELRAAQITNAACLLAALSFVLLLPWLDRRMALWWTLLSLVGPPAWLCVWPHPEVFTCALVTVAVACAWGGRFVLATAALAIASTQNAPLAPLAGALAVLAAIRPPRTARQAALALVAFLPALSPPLFYMAHFGTPSLILVESASFTSISLSKAADLLVDLNMGLLPYVPGVVVLAAVALVAARGQDRLRAAGCGAGFLFGALGASAGVVWNFGTSGPSRYAVWLSPFLIAAAAHLATKRWGRAALSAALAAQAAVVATRLPTWGEDDHKRHSYAATFVLRRWPALYSPHEHIFLDRTPALYQDGPHVFRDGATCRKALAQKRHAEALAAACGPLPEQFVAWSREIARAGVGRDSWRYVDYPR
jgi:hypothetical protein